MDTIYIPRGTCKVLKFNLKMNGDVLEINEDDQLILTVREKASASSPVLLRAAAEKGTGTIILHESDTMLPVGKYSAEVRLHRKGCTYSVWGISEEDTREKNIRNFIILAGVGTDE